VADGSLDFSQVVEAAVLGQVSEVADEVCDGMRVACAAVILVNSNGFGGRGNVAGFIDHCPRHSVHIC
jgi:hypothetical protein